MRRADGGFAQVRPTVNAMGTDGIGSSVVIALAAVLWFVYLVPTWLRRREYLATERNAVRLQQTMRIMAESAEVPRVVRVEASARTIAEQQRTLRREQRLAVAVERSQASARALSRVESDTRGPGRASTLARLRLPQRRESAFAHSSSARLRRSRGFAAMVLLAAVIVAGFGLNQLLTSGSWMLIAASVVVAFGANALLRQMAAVSRARAELARTVRGNPVASQLLDQSEYELAEQQPGWMPVPLPKPLYLSRPAQLEPRRREWHIETSRDIDHAVALRAAALEAERALREAQRVREVTRVTRPAAASASQSRFARMGIINESDAVTADLDAILRRRRAVG